MRSRTNTYESANGGISMVTLHVPVSQDPNRPTHIRNDSVGSVSGAEDEAFMQYVGENKVLIDATPYEWQPPEDADDHPYKPHQGEGSQYLRDFILGVNDGLISTLLLVVGMVGGGQSCRAILLAAISGAVAGSIAMGLGEFIATKSQNEVVVGEIALEKEHFKYHRDQEVSQLRTYLKEVGLDGPLLEAVVKKIGSSDESLMKIMEKFEFGQQASDELERNPLTAMFMSGRLFFMGALPSTLPFLQNDPFQGLWIACLLCGTALFGVGVYKTRTTGGNPLRGGLENLACGAIGAAISYGVGVGYDYARAAAGN